MERTTMREYGFYHPDSGYWQAISYPSDEILASYPEGTIEVPLQPSGLHKFNGEEWIAPTQEEIDAQEAVMIRIQRDIILSNVVDPLVTNPLRWADLSDATKQLWIDYRKALLDITAQVGFPNTVVWPVKPQ